MLLKETALVRLLGLKIPVLLFLGPRVLELDEDGCAIEIPLGYRSKNHLGSMYFGALHAGADLAAGLNATRLILSRHRQVKLIFKDAHAEFLKRADGDVVFRTRSGPTATSSSAPVTAAGSGKRSRRPLAPASASPSRSRSWRPCPRSTARSRWRGSRSA